MIIRSEFDDILKELKDEALDFSKKYPDTIISYQLLGSPLMFSNTLLLGIEWEESIGMHTQKEMPLVNEILVHPNNYTYKGYLSFFSSMLDNDLTKIVQYFNSIIFSNGCLFKTPKDGPHYKEILKEGYARSKNFIQDIIDQTGVQNIICFNSDASYTARIVGEILFDIDNFWGCFEGISEDLASGHHTMQFEGKGRYDNITAYCFPNVNELKIWDLEMMDNPVYQNLKERSGSFN